MSELRIEPVNEEFQRIAIDEDNEGGLKAIVYWQGKQSEETKVLTFESGAQGTWAKLLLSDNRLLCVTQSGNMKPSCYYIVGEEVFLPEEPIVGGIE